MTKNARNSFGRDGVDDEKEKQKGKVFHFSST
jgi:hypothetical protein